MKKKVQKDADELSAWVPPAYTVLKNKFPSLKKTFETLTFCPRFIKHNYSCEICCIFVLLLLRDRGAGGGGHGPPLFDADEFFLRATARSRNMTKCRPKQGRKVSIPLLNTLRGPCCYQFPRYLCLQCIYSAYNIFIFWLFLHVHHKCSVL